MWITVYNLYINRRTFSFVPKQSEFDPSLFRLPSDAAVDFSGLTSSPELSGSSVPAAEAAQTLARVYCGEMAAEFEAVEVC